MAVSKSDAEQILKVMLRYVDKRKVPALIRELRAIGGNKSYRDTIDRIEAEMEK